MERKTGAVFGDKSPAGATMRRRAPADLPKHLGQTVITKNVVECT